MVPYFGTDHSQEYCIELSSFWCAGLNIAAVRYEDLVEQPVKAMQGILRFTDLPLSLAEKAKEALEWDSQKNTPLANSVLRLHATLEYSGDAKIESDEICDKMDATHLGVVYIAPNTITGDHKKWWNTLWFVIQFSRLLHWSQWLLITMIIDD